jgi:hypothetical protein
MATGTLTGTTIAATYKSILKVKGGANQVLDGTPRLLEDGDGNDSVLGISTDSVLISGSGTRLDFNTDGSGEYISGDGTDLTIAAGTALNITADTIDLSDATKDVTLNAAVDALNFDSNTLSIDASNNRVGIGTASPDYGLEVEDGGAGGALRAVSIKSTAASSTSGGGVLLFASDDGAVMADTHRLGSIEFYGAEDTSNTLTVGASITAVTEANWNASDNACALTFLTCAGDNNSAEKMRIDKDGFVGIGTNDPAGLLELKSKTSVACELYLNTTDTSTGSGVASILFGDTTDARGRIDYSNGADAMVFHTSESEAMRIDSSGNVQVEGQFTIQEVSGAGMVSAYKNVAVTGGSATTVFTITHTAGEVYWSAHFKGFAMIGNPAGAMGYECVAVYAQDPGGTEDAVAISETVETSHASWNAGAGNISGIVATLVNTSATVQELKFNVSLGGSDPSGPRVVGVLDLVYYDDGNDNAVVIT